MPILRLSPKNKHFIWGAAGALTILFAILIFALQAIHQARFSASAEAQITRLWSEHIPGSKLGRYLLLEFTYPVQYPDGIQESFQNHGRIYNLDYYQTLNEGSALPLRYDPTHPSDVFFPDDTNPYDIALRFLLPFILLLGGVYCFFNFFWAA